MDVQIRQLSADEMADMRAVTDYVFGNTPGGPPPPLIPEWTTCAFVDGRLATSFATFPFRVRLNSASVAMAGVTMVGTLPEFRRLGLLRRIMTQSFADERAKGNPIAILWASRGAIYQRYGYGLATSWVGYGIDPLKIQFIDGHTGSGRVRITTPTDSREQMVHLYRQFSRPRNLMIQRAVPMWDARLQEIPNEPAIRVGLYNNSDGQTTGYVTFVIRQERNVGQVMEVMDLVYLDPDAYRGLWSFFGSHDIVNRIDLGPVAADDPAPHLLVEPRELKRNTRDGIWMRILDVQDALRQRPYGAAGRLRIGITDPICDWNEGTWLLQTDGAGSSVEADDGEPDISMPVASLAVLLSGNNTATALSKAGLVSASDPEALCRADAMFATRHAPFCMDGF